jgi:hypothetical protein
MASLHRVASCLLLFVVWFAALGLVRPAELKALGLDFWELPELMAQMRQSEQFNEECDQQREHVAEMERRRDEVARAAAEGRLTLAEAAERFRREDEGAIRLLLRDVRTKYPGESEDVLLCRVVLFWVEQVYEEPAQRQAAVSRLQAELNDLRARRKDA